MADVVPVHPDTVDDWTHPPWSGYYDGRSLSLVASFYADFIAGTRIWGRGRYEVS